MPINFQFDFSRPKPPDETPILDKPFFQRGTDEYKKDLAARNGGLRVDRKEDQPQIQAIYEQIANGAMPAQEAERWIHRNPGAESMFKTAKLIADQKEKLNSIIQKNFRPAQVTESEGPVQPGMQRPQEWSQPVANTQQALYEAAQQGVLTPQSESQIVGLANAYNPSRAAQAKPIQVETVDEGGKPITILADSQGKEISRFAGRPKAVPEAALKRIGSSVQVLDLIDNVASTFKPEYGGFKVKSIGEGINTFKKSFGDNSGQVQFWQTYQDFINGVRRDLYGTALTASEKGEFMKAMVHPGMNPKAILENLTRQQLIAENAARKNAGGYISPRFDQDQLTGVLGPWDSKLRQPARARLTEQLKQRTQAPQTGGVKFLGFE